MIEEIILRDSKAVGKGKKKANGIFNTTADALRLLKCERKDYYEHEKNVWYVEMPDFVNHQAIKTKMKEDTLNEMDDGYHDKFRNSKTESDLPQDN